MLVNVPLRGKDNKQAVDIVLEAITQSAKRPNTVENPREGFYIIGHFSFDHLVRGRIEGWDFTLTLPNSPDDEDGLNSYGVCDSPDQFYAVAGAILESDHRKFVVSFTPIIKKDQDPEGGWRWHKWGPYIGWQLPTTEYIYDEPLIEEVYVYHIYRVVE